MTAFKRHRIIPDSQVAVSSRYLDDQTIIESRGNQLRTESSSRVLIEETLEAAAVVNPPPQIWYEDTERNRLVRTALLDSLQLKMIKEIESRLPSEVVILDWDFVGYSEDFIFLKIKFENPDEIGAYDELDLIEVTFWGVEFFKSSEGVEVKLATRLYWQIMRQLTDERAEELDEIIGYVSTFILAVLSLLFLLIGAGGRLLPTWMFVNSLQLFVHTPLLASYMPSGLAYFLKHYLGIERFYSRDLSFSIEPWQT